MKKKFLNFRTVAIAVIAIALIAFVILRIWPGGKQHKIDKSKYVVTTNWNILFQPGVSPSEIVKAKFLLGQYVKDFFTDYNLTYKTFFVPQLKFYSCICDSTLLNLDITCINGQTGSKSTAPPTPKPTQSGDFVKVLSISDNLVIDETPDKESMYKPNDSLYAGVGKISNDKLPRDSDTKILAIIDAGIDNNLFDATSEKLVWRDIPGRPTFFNFLPQQNPGDFRDDRYVKHGSAVAALAIQAMKNARKYPKVMVLKALDSADGGSVFSVACALSYAIQKNAVVVNASLGYYGQSEFVLDHYMKQASTHLPFPVQVFLAAGNTKNPPRHSNDSVTSTRKNLNELNKSRLFYPACYSTVYNNITTVTQLNWPDTPCYYQNYSDRYVTLGIFGGKDTCCFFPLELRKDNAQFYEGSSFAAPVASGLRMVTLINNDSRQAADIAWAQMMLHIQTRQVTKNGSYIYYTP